MICLNKLFLDAEEGSEEAVQICGTVQRRGSVFGTSVRWLWRHT